LQMIKKARALNLKVMMGSMNESSIGTAAIVQFLPQLDYVDADGPLLLSRDVAAGLTFSEGKIETSHLPGLGLSRIQLSPHS
jgi:L-alanine-DL-glutamate epimerase-like enolase superfamily enzyme